MFLAVIQLNATRHFNELGSELMENYVRWFSEFSDIKRIVASWLGVEKFLRNLDPICRIVYRITIESNNDNYTAQNN